MAQRIVCLLCIAVLLLSPNTFANHGGEDEGFTFRLRLLQTAFTRHNQGDVLLKHALPQGDLSPNNRLLAWTDVNHNVHILNLETGEEEFLVEDAHLPKFGPTNKDIMVTMIDKSDGEGNFQNDGVREYNIEEGSFKEVTKIKNVRLLDWSADGKIAIIEEAEPSRLLLRTKPGDLRTMSGVVSAYTNGAFNPDGTIFYWTNENSIHVWNVVENTISSFAWEEEFFTNITWLTTKPEILLVTGVYGQLGFGNFEFANTDVYRLVFDHHWPSTREPTEAMIYKHWGNPYDQEAIIDVFEGGEWVIVGIRKAEELVKP